MRLWPTSAFAQTAMLIAGALLIAQAAGFILLASEQEKAQFFRQYGPFVDQFAALTGKLNATQPDDRSSLMGDAERDGARFLISGQSEISRRGLLRDRALEDQLSEALRVAGVIDPTVEASSLGFDARPDGSPPGPPPDRPQNAPPPQPPPTRLQGPPPAGLPPDAPPSEGAAFHEPPPDGEDSPDSPGRHMYVSLTVRLADGNWLNGEKRVAKLSSDFYWRLAGAEAILALVLLAASLLIAARLTRPLRDLSDAAAGLGSTGMPSPIVAAGPKEVRAAAEAFNEMSRRVNALLTEKDTMLGALAHDLRTPLASLRIRLESMEPEHERERSIETIREMAQTVDDILELARAGRSSEAIQPVDVVALVDSVVEDLRVLGHDVETEETGRIIARLQPSLTKRLLRNLLENAIKFGKRGRVLISRSETMLVLIVEDEGPGIPEDHFGAVLEPFVRLERSRSRETGGVGLGLAIAIAIARRQGGALTFENMHPRGLRVRVDIPV